MNPNMPNQLYFCQHCGWPFEETFWLFLHIFTDHLHKDIGFRSRTPKEKIQIHYLLRVAHHKYHATAAVIGAN